MSTRSARWPSDRERLWRQVTAADFLTDDGEARDAGLRAAAGRRSDGGMTDHNATLALLLAQAEGQGADLVTLRALIEEASGAGAERALAALGLKDEQARRDMDELRELLRAWRDAKRSALEGGGGLGGADPAGAAGRGDGGEARAGLGR